MLPNVGLVGDDLIGTDFVSSIQSSFEHVGDREGFAGHQFKNIGRDHIDAGVYALSEHRLFLNANHRTLSDFQTAERDLM